MSQKEYILKLLESKDPELTVLGYELIKNCIDSKIFAANFKDCTYSPEELVDAYIYWMQSLHNDDLIIDKELLKIVEDTFFIPKGHSIHSLLIDSIK